MQGLLALAATLFGLSFMFPWTRLLVNTRSLLLVALTTLALSGGALSLILFWLGLLTGSVDWRVTLLISVILGSLGLIVARRTPAAPEPQAEPRQRLPRSLLPTIGNLIVIGMAALIVFNAVYWPFHIDDAVAIYAWHGKQIALSRALPPLAPGQLYEAYPMAVPLLYAYTHSAAGWIDEGLAALIPALFAVGVIGVAYQLGQHLYSRQAGGFAALIVALTPMFTHWASAGYVDLPSGFFYGMAALFAWRWYTALPDGRESWREALLAGLTAGLAAWIKNSGLLIVGSLALWWLYVLWHGWQGGQRANGRLALRDGALLIGGFLAVCGPWYARNLALAGVIVPPTGWTWLAERTLGSLLPYLTDRRYALPGLAFTAGLLFVAARAVLSRLQDAPALLFVIFYAPFFAVWWALFSYDGRFLLALTPLVAVAAAHLLEQLYRPIATLITGGDRRGAFLSLLGAAGLIALAVPAAFDAVDFKDELIRDPLMSIEARHRLVLGARYDVALRLRELPAGSHVWTSDLLLPYHADGVRVTVGGMPDRPGIPADQPFEYLVLRPGEAPPSWLAASESVWDVAAWRLYRVWP